MAATDMGELLENLDRRLARIAQILPTLATRTDVDDVKRLARVLHESTHHDIKIVAEGVASLTEQLQRKGVI